MLLATTANSDIAKPKRKVTDLVHHRLRGLGGTTEVWGGACLPFDEVNFAVRDWVSNSGWPIEGAPAIITQIANGKRQIKLGAVHPTRDFNYVADTVAGFMVALESNLGIGEVINIGSNF